MLLMLYFHVEVERITCMEYILEDKKVFTTGELAEIFEVNINTVVKWFETGLLKGFKLPGSTARRVPRQELLEFILSTITVLI